MEAILSKMTPPDKGDLVQSVTIEKSVIANPGATDNQGQKLPRLAVLDCGIKYNIIRELCRRFEVVWCPASMTFDEIMDQWRPDALFASNGPGDPAHEGTATVARESLAAAVRADMPVMGICLGHQLMGLAAGLRTYKLRYGHRGSNQPVVDLVTGKVNITSQNHGFALSADSLDQGVVAVTHFNLNDRTVAAIAHRQKPVFGVQYHPEASPGPHDADHHFARFVALMDDRRP